MNEGFYIFDADRAEWFDGEGRFTANIDGAACYRTKSEAVRHMLGTGVESAQIIQILDLGTYNEFAESA